MNYLKGLSFEQTIFYGILTRLKKYNQLPNIIFYECSMNINGERIIKAKEKIYPGFQEIDYAFYSIIDFSFEERNFPLYVQSEFYINKDQLIKDENEHIFKIHKDRIYFFELKNYLKYNKIKTYENDSDKKLKDSNELLLNLIKKCKVFASLYISEFSLP